MALRKFFQIIKRLFGGSPPPKAVPKPLGDSSSSAESWNSVSTPPAPSDSFATATAVVALETEDDHARVHLVPLQYRSGSQKPLPRETEQLPYQFAQFSVLFDGYLDLSDDLNPQQLTHWRLPQLATPEQLANWLGLPLGQVAWLIHRFSEGYRPENERAAHYAFTWLAKRKGGYRLIESPKPCLKKVQELILHEILNQVPSHPAAHGFVKDRSIKSNAAPHVGKKVIIKFDLENFYASVKFSRVVAIFRTMGFSREAGIWLARLYTSDIPANIRLPAGSAASLQAYAGRHLPQGAPTSPALANLSAYSLDVRLAGMAKAFNANYTRYADDLTFSGGEDLISSLPVFVPLVTKIIRSERFKVNARKRKIIRNNCRQTVAGVVVNQTPNISRNEFDKLKATLTNCVRQGPQTQNHDNHTDFAAHLRGRIAHVAFLNPHRGQKLLEIFNQITW